MTFLLKVEENLIPRRKKEITFHDYAVTTLKNIIYTIKLLKAKVLMKTYAFPGISDKFNLNFVAIFSEAGLRTRHV